MSRGRDRELWVPVSAAVGVTAFSTAVLVGWAAGVPSIVQLVPGYAPMQANTAVCLLLLGLAVCSLGMGRSHAPTWTWLPAAALALFTGLEHGIGRALGIDRLFPAIDLFPGIIAPGRMAPLTAAALGAAALAVPCASRDGRDRAPSAVFLASVPLAIGGFVLFEYAIGAPWLDDWQRTMRIAPHTAASAATLGAALLAVVWARSIESREPLPRWAPAWAGCFLAAVTLAIVGAMRERDLEHAQARAMATADDLGASVGREVSNLRNACELLAARLPRPDSHAAWHQDASMLWRHAGDPYAVIYRLDEVLTPVAVWPEQSAGLPSRERLVAAGPVLTALQTAGARRRPVVSRRAEVAPGIPGFVIAAPVLSSGQPAGFVLATMAYEPLFARILSSSDQDVRVSADGQVLYTNRRWPGRARLGVTAIDVGGDTWDLEIAPAADVRGWQGTSIWVAVLAFGLLLSAAIGCLAALMRQVQRQGSAAQEVNARLELEIRQRRQTETQLGSALTFLRTVLDSTSYSIIGTDLEGVIRTFNRSAERMLGYSADEVIGRFTPLLIHDPNEIAQRAVQLSTELERAVNPGFEVFVETARKHEVDRRDWTYVRKDGTRFPVELSVTAIVDAEGRVTGFMGTAVDITARRHSELLRRWAEDSLRRTEELLHSVLDASLNGVLAFKCVRDDDGRIVDLECVMANPAAERLLGQPAGTLVGRSHVEVTGAGPGHSLFQAYAGVVDTGEPLDLEFQSAVFDNRWFRIVATPIGHDGVSVTFEDITRRKDVDAELTRARDHALAGAREMERALKMQSDFVSFASHQLRTPLSGLRWLLELAKDEPGQTDDMRSYVADSLASTGRLIGLVNDLLDVSRLEDGRVAPALADMDLAASCREVIEALGPNLELAGHSLATAGLDEPAGVRGDAQLVRQVVANLLSNAIKYTPGQGHLSITVFRHGHEFRCAVEDDGIGVPESGRARLFEKFFRADNVATVETEGTGLGLYMVRLILQKFDGRIWFECPASGRGSRFVFALPFGGTEGVEDAAA